MVELRCILQLPLDDLLAVTREFPHGPFGLDRCLRRHGVGNLRDLIPEENAKAPVKTFKEYEPGFVHIDIKYLPLC